MNIQKFYESKKILERFYNGEYSHIDSKFLEALDIVAFNEKSEKTREIINRVIKIAKSKGNKKLLIHLLYLQFNQIWVFRHMRKKIKSIVEQINYLANELSENKYKALAKHANFLFLLQDKMFFDTKKEPYWLKLLEEIKEAYQLVTKKDLPYYYGIAYSYAYFYFRLEKKDMEKTLKILYECLKYFSTQGYWSKATSNTIRLILSVYLTYHPAKIPQIIKELVTDNKDVIENFLPVDKASLHEFLSLALIKTNKIRDGIAYLEMVYNEMKCVSEEYPYYFSNVLLWLSRSYLYLGNVERAYSTIEEFYNFLTTPEIKRKINKTIYTIYYYAIISSVLFIFSEIEVDINKLESPILIEIIEKGNALAERMIKELKKNDLMLIRKNANIFLLQSIIDHLKKQCISSGKQPKFLKKIEDLKSSIPESFAENKIFVEITKARNLLALGHLEEFKRIVEEISKNEKIPNIKHIKVWIKALNAIYDYLEDNDLNKLVINLEKLRIDCEQLNLSKQASEIEFYKRMIQSSHLLKENKEKFQQALYIDLFIAEAVRKGKEMLSNG